MCRRLFQNLPPEDMRQWFRTTNAVPNAQPPYNAAPTQDLAVGRYNPETGERSLTCSAGAHSSLGAGLVDRHRLINARAESVASKSLSGTHPPPALPGASRRLLRMETGRRQETTLCDRPV